LKIIACNLKEGSCAGAFATPSVLFLRAMHLCPVCGNTRNALLGYGGGLGTDRRHTGKEKERDFGHRKNRFYCHNGLRRMLQWLF